MIQGGGDQIADQLAQRRLIARLGQPEAVHVAVEVEVRVLLEGWPSQRQMALDHALAKARVGLHEARADDLAQALLVHALVEEHHGVDHHQVGGPVHVQPCDVRARQAVGHHDSPS